MPRKWTEDDDATLMQMRQNGHSLAEIARRLGRSRSSVDTRRYLLAGLRNRPPKRPNEMPRAPRPCELPDPGPPRWRVGEHWTGRTVTRPDGISLPFVTLIHAHLLETA